MKRWLRSNYLLLIILILASTLRLVALDRYPSGLNADEAAIGYNAYSLIQTGKDEFGHPWPINFQSFNDYKPGLYFYLVLPFVKLLGLNEWAVRLPSALLGILSVFLIYKLTDYLFKNRPVALLTALLLAVNPWHLHFSRGGWESNAALTFVLLGIYLLIAGYPCKKKLTFGLLSILASMYTYHSARLVAPLIVLAIFVSWIREVGVIKTIKVTLIPVITFLVFCVPLIISLTGNAGVSRFSGVGLFADTGPFWRANEMRAQHADYLSLMPTLLHNRYLEYGIRFVDNYLRHFSGDFLFISGDEIQRNRVPEMGQLLLIQIPLLLLGVFYFIKDNGKNKFLVLWWLIVTPLASSLTFQSPHAIRSLLMIIPLTIISGYGGIKIIGLISQIRVRPIIHNTLYIILVFIFSWNVFFYLHQYYVHYPQTYPAAWEYGFKPLVNYLNINHDKYDKIYITNEYDQPYILTAFYLKYPPDVFQNEAVLTDRDRFGFSTVEKFGKYNFGVINLDDHYSPRSLIIGTPKEIPNDSGIIERVYYPDGKQEAFRIIER